MNQKRIIFQGALILTITGFVGRILGFFYKIFLSRAIGAQGVGIYQLVFPVYTTALSLTASGIQTAISRNVSEHMARGDKREARRTFTAGLLLTLVGAIPVSLFLYFGSSWIADTLLMEYTCRELIRPLALALPFSGIHACASGYYYGQKKTVIPSIAQLIEQILRIPAFLFLCQILLEQQRTITPLLAVIVLVIEELCSALFILTCVFLSIKKERSTGQFTPFPDLLPFRRILSVSLPLTGNRILINLLQSMEAVCIPLRLQLSGLSDADSLSVYGILTGMAMPLILFPCAITNALSVMLLPTISEAHIKKESASIAKTIELTIRYTFCLGFLCTIFFLCFGTFLGSMLFGNSQVGPFLMTLSWICPFLYLNGTLGSILHGLGKTNAVFWDSVLSLTLRILFVWFAIPIWGIQGYLWGLLASQLLSFVLSLLVLSRSTEVSFTLFRKS